MATDPLPPHLHEYLDSLVPPRPPEMQAMEAYAKQTNFPIIGPASGYFCYQVARMIGARRVFELGSGYGYSTAWFAKAVQENGGGEVHHVVWDEQLSQQARGHLGALGFGDLMTYHVGEAVQALREAAGPFDLIFNDIDKHGYPASLPVIAAKLRPGGAVLLEIGATQAAAVMDLAQRAFPNATVSVHRDLAGLDRVVVIDDKMAR